MGYIELPLEFMGHTFEDMGFPIVKDPVCTQLVERKVLVPGVGARCWCQVLLAAISSETSRTHCQQVMGTTFRSWRQLVHMHGHMC